MRYYFCGTYHFLNLKIKIKMKKLLSLLFVTAFVIAANAQFGINAGLNLSTLHGNDVTDAKAKTGFHFGALYQIPVSKGITVQTEAAYSAEGCKFEESGESAKFNFDYLNLAALFRYNFDGGFNLATGPQYGFLLSAKLKADGESEDFKDELKSGNFSWAFAAGYDLPMGFGFYARYNLGLAGIEKESGGDHVKASTFQFGVRYNLKMDKK